MVQDMKKMSVTGWGRKTAIDAVNGDFVGRTHYAWEDEYKICIKYL